MQCNSAAGCKSAKQAVQRPQDQLRLITVHLSLHNRQTARPVMLPMHSNSQHRFINYHSPTGRQNYSRGQVFHYSKMLADHKQFAVVMGKARQMPVQAPCPAPMQPDLLEQKQALAPNADEVL